MKNNAPTETESRIMAYVNWKPEELTAHCENCGKPIPVELVLCDLCDEREDTEYKY